MNIKKLTQEKNESRSTYLLRVAAAYIEEYCDDETIYYDDAECDGYSLIQDIRSELENVAAAASSPEE